MDYPEIRIDKSSEILSVSKVQLMNLTHYISVVRCDGELRNKAIYLPTQFDGVAVDKWVIVQDSTGHVCAVPLLNKESDG